MYKKVLVVSNMYPSKKYPSYGVFVKNFCDQLTEIGIQNEISVLTKTNKKITKAIKYIIFYAQTFIRCMFGNYDLVYVHYPSYSSKPVLLAKRIKRFDIITNVHGTDVVPLKPRHEKMLGNTKKAIASSKIVVVPSEYYKRKIITKYEIEEERVFVYPSAGVNEKTFFEYDPQKKDELKREFDIKEGAFVIGYVSRINKAKGWEVLIDALEIGQIPLNQDIKIFIVGSGEDDNELEERINKLPNEIKSCVVRYPLLEQKKLADIYNLLDVFVFPTMSESESLGLVAIEAMACGCPVIASDYAAPKYYVVDNVNGYKFQLGNSHMLASIITKLLENRKEIGFLKTGAIKTADKFKTNALKPLLQRLMEV